VNPASILVCRDARAVHWQLGPLPPPRGRFTLIAWKDGAAGDGGVPAAITGVLARSWTSIARVTFLSSVGGARDGTIVSTRDAAAAARVFDDAAFPWWLQGQAAVLSDPDAAPPAVDKPSLLALFEEDWAVRAAAIEPRGVRGVARPGVDGDVAGLLALTDEFDARLLESLEREARVAGVGWTVVPETAL